jgi:enhancing lycopene biosynthesis protein 2
MTRSMTKRIAVVLSGCGNKDGSEVLESVSLILNLSQAGVEVQYFAPNENFTPENFLTGEKLPLRNVMAESARISRSQIADLKTLSANDFEALALPGGMGAATNLCTWAKEGAKCQVNADLEKAIRDFHAQSKPIAAICIAPTILARVLGKHKITVTIGDSKETAAEIEKTGAHHEVCPVEDYVTDREHKIITTPAYMYAKAKPHQIHKGITALCKEFLEMS